MLSELCVQNRSQVLLVVLVSSPLLCLYGMHHQDNIQQDMPIPMPHLKT